jgi:N6-L-threonylcarbamoyladenine synthase
MLHKQNFDFSYSGLKTALRTHAASFKDPMTDRELRDTCASFQEAAVEILVVKTFAAAREAGVNEVAVCGGVACNSRLRERFAAMAKAKKVRLVIPRPRYCTDNAVMVAAVGYRRYLDGVRGGLDLNAVPTWPLES